MSLVTWSSLVTMRKAVWYEVVRVKAWFEDERMEGKELDTASIENSRNFAAKDKKKMWWYLDGKVRPRLFFEDKRHSNMFVC